MGWLAPGAGRTRSSGVGGFRGMHLFQEGTPGLAFRAFAQPFARLEATFLTDKKIREVLEVIPDPNRP